MTQQQMKRPLSPKKAAHMRAMSDAKIKHGLCAHPLYSKWSTIIARCEREGASSYENYGARGIRICREWRSDFHAFYEWAIAAGWTPELHIDRIDNNGHYEPANCRWVTAKENMQNRRTTKIDAAMALTIFKADGKPMELSRQLGVPFSIVWRIKRGLSWTNVTMAG